MTPKSRSGCGKGRCVEIISLIGTDGFSVLKQDICSNDADNGVDHLLQNLGYRSWNHRSLPLEKSSKHTHHRYNDKSRRQHPKGIGTHTHLHHASRKQIRPEENDQADTASNNDGKKERRLKDSVCVLFLMPGQSGRNQLGDRKRHTVGCQNQRDTVDLIRHLIKPLSGRP